MVGAGLWMINVLDSTMLVQYVCLKIVLLNQNVADTAQVICEYLLYAEYTHTIIVLSD